MVFFMQSPGRQRRCRWTSVTKTAKQTLGIVLKTKHINLDGVHVRYVCSVCIYVNLTNICLKLHMYIGPSLNIIMLGGWVWDASLCMQSIARVLNQLIIVMCSFNYTIKKVMIEVHHYDFNLKLADQNSLLKKEIPSVAVSVKFNRDTY